MSLVLEYLLKYAESVATPEWKADEIRSGIVAYLNDFSQFISADDKQAAELEMRRIKELPVSSFNEYFARYAYRQAVSEIDFTAWSAALDRNMKGKILGQDKYNMLNNRILYAITEIHPDAFDKKWQKRKLKEAFIYLKYASGLLNRLPANNAITSHE